MTILFDVTNNTTILVELSVGMASFSSSFYIVGLSPAQIQEYLVILCKDSLCLGYLLSYVMYVIFIEVYIFLF